MNRHHARALIILGTVILLVQVLGFPFLWKQWMTAIAGIGLVSWGLYLRYGTKTSHEQ